MKSYIAEPFKIKMVEPIKITTRGERIKALEDANYNLFSIRADKVYIDLLTDSGTGAMSQHQWAGLIQGDESYAGAESYYHLLDSCKDIFDYKYFQPVHQGRAAEKVFFELFTTGKEYGISNTFFDTTRAHVELSGCKPIDYPCVEAVDIDTFHPFKGDIDIEKTKAFIEKVGNEKIAFIVMTLTNNAIGGQPVSMKNMKDISAVAKKYNLPLIIDAARFAENAYFVKERESGYKDKTIAEIVKETFSYADAFVMSAKKDAIVNMGGLVGIKEDDDLYFNVKARVVPFEGFVTYGGLAGRDLEALSIGLYEGMDYEYLKYRVGQVEYVGEGIRDLGISVQYPLGGHAVYINAGKMLPHIPFYEFPGVSLANELYIEAGIRGIEAGTLGLGGRDKETGELIAAPMELVRLAIPRRVYTQSHMDIVIDAVGAIKDRAKDIKGYEFEYEPPILRHFSSKLKLVK